MSALDPIAAELRALGEEWRGEWPDGRVCKADLNRIADQVDGAARTAQTETIPLATLREWIASRRAWTEQAGRTPSERTLGHRFALDMLGELLLDRHETGDETDDELDGPDGDDR